MNLTLARDTWIQHVETEHRHLCHLLHDLRRAFEKTTGGSADSSDLRIKLAELREALEKHFALEEEGGYLEEAIARRPSLSHDADKLLSEHPRLLAAVTALTNHLNAQPASADAWQQLRSEFSTLAIQMIDHESREHWLLSQGFNEAADEDET